QNFQGQRTLRSCILFAAASRFIDSGAQEVAPAPFSRRITGTRSAVGPSCEPCRRMSRHRVQKTNSARPGISAGHRREGRPAEPWIMHGPAGKPLPGSGRLHLERRAEAIFLLLGENLAHALEREEVRIEQRQHAVLAELAELVTA